MEATSYGDAHDEVRVYVSVSVEEKGHIPTYLPDDLVAVIG